MAPFENRMQFNKGIKDKKQNPIKSAIGQHPAENSTYSLLVMEPRKKSRRDVIQCREHQSISKENLIRIIRAKRKRME